MGWVRKKRKWTNIEDIYIYRKLIKNNTKKGWRLALITITINSTSTEIRSRMVAGGVRGLFEQKDLLYIDSTSQLLQTDHPRELNPGTPGNLIEIGGTSTR